MVSEVSAAALDNDSERLKLGQLYNEVNLLFYYTLRELHLPFEESLRMINRRELSRKNVYLTA